MQDNYVAQKALPRITVRLNGVVQPIPVPATKQRFVVVIPGRGADADVEVQGGDEPRDIADMDANLDTSRKANKDPDSKKPKAPLGEEGELQEQVAAFIGKEGEETDAEDAPDWCFEDGEVRSKDLKYVFCAAEHRKPLLHLFTKHFCQHPMFPDRDGTHTKEEIRTNAVCEMYLFCWQRGLREVWGYMWAQWYSPKRWALWARSTSFYISRLRTTMNVENFWKQLKHNYLHHFLRPRLNQLLWILCTKVTPAIYLRSEVLDDTHRLGRSRPLTTYQRYFKRDWKKQSKADISGRTYKTNVESWTCDCGTQKYNRHHVCKHLVQAVPKPPQSFWRDIHRRRATPIYRHSALHPIPEDGMDPTTYEMLDGSISEGDDHVSTGSGDILKGGGGWRDYAGKVSEKMLGKRRRVDDESETENTTPSHCASTSISISSSDTEDMRPMELDGNDSDEEVRIIVAEVLST